MEACDIYEGEEKEHFSLEAFKVSLKSWSLRTHCRDEIRCLENETLKCLVFFRKKGALGLLVRAERWDEAIKILERQCVVFDKIKQGHNVCKACLSILIIHLHRDDYIAADRAYNELLS